MKKQEASAAILSQTTQGVDDQARRELNDSTAAKEKING
jgi:hypothetical protein